MNQIATRPETSINTIGMATGAGGSSIAPQNLGEVVRFAEVMCKADIALPKHLRGNAGACMAVALQALEWRMSPFAVASKSYSVNGQIAYEAQLIMAVINTRSGIEGRLKFRFEGEGQDRVCIAFGILDGEELEVRSPKFRDITPKNSPLWKSDPDQQHCYYTARAWGRRHTPEVILGVYDREEVEQFRGSENARDVTPSFAERLHMARIEQHEAAGSHEGFDADFVTRETDGLSAGAEADEEQSSEDHTTETGSGADLTADPDEAGEPAPEATDGPDAVGSPADPTKLSDEDRKWLIMAARMLIPSAAPNGDPDVVRKQYGILIKTQTPPSISQLAIGKAVSISKRLVAVCESTEELDLELLAGIAGCTVEEIRT